MRLPRVLPAVAVLTAAAALSGCAARAQPAPAHVVVSVAPSADPVDLEVHVASARGPYRAVHRMRSGETRTFAAPAGWVVVRVPGLCVVPTANRGTSVVEVGRDSCRLA